MDFSSPVSAANFQMCPKRKESNSATCKCYLWSVESRESRVESVERFAAHTHTFDVHRPWMWLKIERTIVVFFLHLSTFHYNIVILKQGQGYGRIWVTTREIDYSIWTKKHYIRNINFTLNNSCIVPFRTFSLFFLEVLLSLGLVLNTQFRSCNQFKLLLTIVKCTR